MFGSERVYSEIVMENAPVHLFNRVAIVFGNYCCTGHEQNEGSYSVDLCDLAINSLVQQPARMKIPELELISVDIFRGTLPIVLMIFVK